MRLSYCASHSFWALAFMLPGGTSAAEKSYYSPIINIDVDNSRILISTLRRGLLGGGAGSRPSPYGETAAIWTGRYRGGNAGGPAPAVEKLEDQIRRVHLPALSTEKPANEPRPTEWRAFELFAHALCTISLIS